MFSFFSAALILLVIQVTSTPLQPTFSSCLSSFPPVASGPGLLDVTNIYANLVTGAEASKLGLVGGGHEVLRVDLIGITAEEILGYDNSTNKLATLFTTTDTASFNIFSSISWLCNSLFPSTLPEPYHPDNTTYCPLPAGDFALNLSIPLYRSYALTTLRTQVRIVDTALATNTIACVNIDFTPYRNTGWYYRLFLWLPAATAIGFWATTWGARFAAGWIIGSGVAEYGQKEGHGPRTERVGNKEAIMRKWGTMIVSGLSGERLSVSAGLLRFVTPGLRDIIYHVQFCTILGMIAVDWPAFAYPILAQGSWADLVGNVTLIQGSNAVSDRIDAYPTGYNPPANFVGMLSDPLYPLYLDSAAFNPLLDLRSSSNGMQSWATALGLREQDLFGTCLAIFLMIAAGITVLSLLLWSIHALVEMSSSERPKTRTGPQRNSLGSSPRTSRSSLGGKEALRPSSYGSDLKGPFLPTQANQPHRGSAPSRLRRTWLRFRPKGEAGAFHAAALYGNLLRLIAMFHLPITTFSIYQLVLGSRASIVSRVFASLAFVFISLLIPAGIMFKISGTPSGKLYDATRTLLSLGPMYNVYVEGKQMFRVLPIVASLIIGIVVGAGQSSGIAQAVILVVVELAMLIVPALWYPWGEGASMGAPGALLGVIRVASMVMVMILSPAFDVIDSTKDWLAYAILLLQAIAFVFFVFMLFTKIVEGLIRLVGGVHFDESTHPLDGGLFAAIMDLDCLNGVRGGKAAARRRRKRGSKQLQRNVSAAGSLTTQMMLDRHSQGVARLPMSEGQTPFLTTYPKNVEEDHFPVLQPPLGPPPPERHSWESRSDEPSTGHIMDAWHPPATAAGYAAPGGYVPSGSTPTGANEPDNAPKRSFSVVRGGQADYRDPYTVKDRAYMAQALAAPSPRMSQAGQRSTAPKHARHQSSSALVEVVDGVPLTSPSNTSLVNAPGLRLNNEGVRPPALAIPKRRSLNTLKDERGASPDSPDSKYSHSAKAKKGKRSSKPSAWFSKALVESEESDDEPGPSRRKGRRTSRGPIPFEPVPMSPEEPKKGWRSAIGLGRKKSLDAIAEQARDENKARKAALAAQSGALFAGVEAPTPSPAKKAFVVNRKSSVPTAAPIAEYGGGSTSPSSFRVKRLAQPSPAPIPTPLAPPASSTPPVTTAAAPRSPVRSFQVIRPQIQSPTMGSFAVSRPVVHHAPFPPIPDADIGYAPSSFVPLSETRSTSSGAEPTRPPRDPRRPSQESGRGYAL